MGSQPATHMVAAHIGKDSVYGIASLLNVNVDCGSLAGTDRHHRCIRWSGPVFLVAHRYRSIEENIDMCQKFMETDMEAKKSRAEKGHGKCGLEMSGKSISAGRIFQERKAAWQPQ